MGMMKGNQIRGRPYKIENGWMTFGSGATEHYRQDRQTFQFNTHFQAYAAL